MNASKAKKVWKMKTSYRAVYWVHLLLVMVLANSAWGQVGVLTQRYDNQRSGANTNETVLNQSNLNSTGFGLLFRFRTDDQVYSQPLYVPNLAISGGTHNVVYVTTENNSVYAFDADSGTQYWHVNLGAPQNASDVGTLCTDITGNIGITDTPAIDLTSNTLYTVSSTKVNGTFFQHLHALDITTGAEKFGGPMQITAPGFNAIKQLQRASLLLDNGLIYIMWASNCDVTPYNGYIMSYDASTLTQVAVFNDTAGGTEGGIWQSGQGALVDSSGNIYTSTGNGSWNGTTQFGMSFLKFNSNLSLLDWFTPFNWSSLNGIDADIASSGPILVPGTNLLAGGGKPGVLYVLNTTNMGHLVNNDTQIVQKFQATTTGSCTNGLHGAPVYYNSPANGPEIYLWAGGDTLRAYKFSTSTGLFATTPFQTSSFSDPCGETGCFLAASSNNGASGSGIIWANCPLSGDASPATRPGVLYAFNADNLGSELWSNQQNATRDSCNNFGKFSPATVANGKVYLASFGTANSGSGQVCAYGLLTGGCSTPTTPSALSATDVSGSEIDLSWGASTSSCAVSYSVFRSTTNGFTPSSANQIASGLTTTSFANTGLNGSTTYYYLVEAVASGVASSPSNQANATTLAGPVVYAAASLTVAASSGQAVSTFADANCDGGSCVFYNSAAVGNFISFSVNVPAAGTYDIKTAYKTITTRGIFQLAVAPSVSGPFTNLGPTVDEYGATATYPNTDLGNFTFSSAGTWVFRYTVTGKNAASSNFTLSFSSITLTPVTGTSTVYAATSLAIAASSGQPESTFTDANCDGGSCVFYNSSAVGNFISFNVTVPTAGTYDIKTAYKTITTRGIFQLAVAPSVSGTYTNVGPTVDEYGATATYPNTDLGAFTFGTGGTWVFRYTVTGKNAASSGFTLSFSSITLTPQ